MTDPHPSRPENGCQQRFGMAGGHIDDEMRDSPFGYRLQMRTDGINVNTLYEIGARLKDGPSLHHKSFKAPPGPFGPHLLQVEFSRVQKGSRVDRVLRR